MMRVHTLLLSTLIVVIASSALHGQELKQDWQLTDIAGRIHKPFESGSTRGIVLVFVSSDCPIANSYQPLLRRLSEQHEDNGIRFFQIHPRVTTTIQDARKHASDFEIVSPVLIDTDQEITKRVGATRTPEVAVYLRDEKTPIYQGRIDNRYASYGKKRKFATSNELADVLDELAAGRPLRRTTTKPIGCMIQFQTRD